MRFETNLPQVFYEAIVARLSEILGQEVAVPHTNPVSYYQNQCRLLLDGAIAQKVRILLIIDGLDEALGGDFSASWFPRNPGPGLRLLVSARLQLDRDASGWVARLGWDRGVRVETRDLPILDSSGIEDVLGKGRTPVEVLASEPEVVRKLYRLTEGEPLLLGLYVEDLWRQREDPCGLRTVDLDRIKPGLRGYFEDCLGRQRGVWEQERRGESETQKLYAYLSVLACAHGPLTGGELGQLAERAFGAIPGFRIEDTLYPIRRFVINTRDTSQGEEVGYVLTHPKLGEFLREEYFINTRIQRTRQAFAAWGRDILRELDNGALEPRNTPSYLLKYLGQHFEDAGAVGSDFMSLVERGWLHACEAYERSYHGFSQDVQRAYDTAKRRGTKRGHRLALQLRCQLVLSSIGSTGLRVPGQLMVECVKKGLIAPRQALEWAAWHRGTEVFVNLVPHLPESLLGEAVHAAEAIRNSSGRFRVLTALAPRLSDAERVNVLARALGTIEGSVLVYGEERAALLTNFAAYMPEANRAEVLAQALRAAKEIVNPKARTNALAVLAPGLPEAERSGVLDEALHATQTIKEEWFRAEALTVLAPALPDSLLGAALQTAKAIEYEPTRAKALAALAPQLPKALLGEALQTAREFRICECRTQALAALMPYVPTAERPSVLGEALQTANAFGDERLRARSLAALASHLVPGLPRDALQSAITGIEDCDSRALALAALAPHLVEPERTSMFADGLKAAGVAKYEETRVEFIAAVGSHLPTELSRQALIMATTISEDYLRANALSVLAPHLPRELLRDALQAAKAIEDEGHRLKALEDLAPHLPKALLIEALKATEPVGDEGPRAKALAALAKHLPNALRNRAQMAALETLKAVRDDQSRVEVLRLLAPCLHVELFGEALRAAKQIRDDNPRAEALTAFAPYLPDSLLGETLQASDALYEVERARTLAALAPRLSGSVLRTALAGARAIKNEWQRAEALIALALRSPGAERADLLAEALRAARALGYVGSKARVLTVVAQHLSAAQRAAALDEALQAAREVGDNYSRVWCLLDVACLLPKGERRAVAAEALQAARAIEVRTSNDSANAASALTAVAPHLPETQRTGTLVDALNFVMAITNVKSLTCSLLRLIPHLPQALLGQALQVTRTIHDYPSRVQALIAVARHLPEAEHADILGEALQAARWIPKWQYEPRAQAMIAVAAILPEANRANVLGEVLQSAGKIGNEELRAQALADLVSHLPERLQVVALNGFTAAASTLPRSKLLSLLPSFYPTIARLGGSAGLREVHRALHDTSEWFP
jgi:hypothetical protein